MSCETTPTTKRCTKCGEEKALECFSTGRAVCKACRAAYMRTYHDAHCAANRDKRSSQRREYYAANRGEISARCRKYRDANRDRMALYMRKYNDANRAKRLIKAASHRAKSKCLPFDTNRHIEELRRRFDAGRCELSGLPFNLNVRGRPNWDSPSLDRIDPEKGYVINNVRWVLHGLNMSMSEWGEEILFKIVDAVREHRRDLTQPSNPTQEKRDALSFFR